MPKNEHQIKIFQVNLSALKFLSPGFFTQIMEDNKQVELGIERNNYYLIRTSAHVSWLQPTKELKTYHLFLNLCSRRGFNHLMIIKDK